MKTSKKGGVTAFDINAGKVLKLLRTEFDYSLSEFAAALNITYQQIQKYETGTNKIPASRYEDFEELFGAPKEIFFKPVNEVKAIIKKNPQKLFQEDNFEEKFLKKFFLKKINDFQSNSKNWEKLETKDQLALSILMKSLSQINSGTSTANE